MCQGPTRDIPDIRSGGSAERIHYLALDALIVVYSYHMMVPDYFVTLMGYRKKRSGYVPYKVEGSIVIVGSFLSNTRNSMFSGVLSFIRVCVILKDVCLEVSGSIILLIRGYSRSDVLFLPIENWPPKVGE